MEENSIEKLYLKKYPYVPIFKIIFQPWWICKCILKHQESGFSEFSSIIADYVKCILRHLRVSFFTIFFKHGGLLRHLRLSFFKIFPNHGDKCMQISKVFESSKFFSFFITYFAFSSGSKGVYSEIRPLYNLSPCLLILRYFTLFYVLGGHFFQPFYILRCFEYFLVWFVIKKIRYHLLSWVENNRE